MPSLTQVFVDASFEHITSTDNALGLLAQFTEVLQRDALQQQLEGKWLVRSGVGGWRRAHPDFHAGVARVAGARAQPKTPPKPAPCPRAQVIFQHYARDLETVQAIYEANKHKPPLPRNAPPIVSGPPPPRTCGFKWTAARLLLRPGR